MLLTKGECWLARIDDKGADPGTVCPAAAVAGMGSATFVVYVLRQDKARRIDTKL